MRWFDMGAFGSRAGTVQIALQEARRLPARDDLGQPTIDRLHQLRIPPQENCLVSVGEGAGIRAA